MRLEKLRVKTILIVFFDITSIHREFVPQRKIITKKFYKVLKKLWDRIRRVRHEIFDSNNWLLYNNAPAHSAINIKQFLAKKLILVIKPLLYSPEASADYFLFSKSKEHERNTIFDDRRSRLLRKYTILFCGKCYSFVVASVFHRYFIGTVYIHIQWKVKK